ncbi:MAG: cytochrome c3 family protein [Acidobacteria bacterium]|nr:cytochrome c3 family protein [Acidobacteriota bacterium]
MSPKKRSTGQKGSYGDTELPVAREYPERLSRNRMLFVGVALVTLVLALVAVDQYFGRGALSSNGPLSSNHAGLEEDCGNCHDPEARQASDERCVVCHEKYGDELGVYNFAAHYLYRSDDFRRLVPGQHEVPCFTCHIEHEGRDVEITRVTDARCQKCHFGSFAKQHPQFDFVAERIPDSSALAFTHIHHVGEVMKRQNFEDIEKSCLVCHNANPDGRGFAPIDFDRHCDACHLTAAISTPGLPIRTPESGAFGVATLEQILESRGPGARWAYFTDPNEYRRRGSLLVKRPVHHRDPWLLENLRTLRQSLYPEAGLADLLGVSAAAEPHEVRGLYLEAVATLEDQALGLRGRPEPEIQAELARIDELLTRLKRDVEKPFAPIDESSFLLALGERNPELSQEQVTAIETLVEDLTTPCRQCHLVENATIVRVRAGQTALRRAEFDHRAHILQTRCLDCHTEIPISENVGAETQPDASVDNASIQNIPAIETCRECHTPRLASDRCVTCHLFHPNKSRRSELLLYLDEAP